MATPQSAPGTQFKIVQVDGYRENELYTADNLDQVREFLSQKGGANDADA